MLASAELRIKEIIAVTFVSLIGPCIQKSTMLRGSYIRIALVLARWTARVNVFCLHVRQCKRLTQLIRNAFNALQLVLSVSILTHSGTTKLFSALNASIISTHMTAGVRAMAR